MNEPGPEPTEAMSWHGEALNLLYGYARRTALPRVRALHLPPDPAPDRMRGEFCALELEDGRSEEHTSELQSH